MFGVGCFTRVDAARQPPRPPRPPQRQQRRDLARGYVREVGDPSNEFGRVAQCDVVEPPLAVFGRQPEALAAHLAALALALLRGRGHMASEEATALLAASGSPFGGRGAFGFTVHAMSWDTAYSGARHVPWEMTAWQLWNASSTCFQSRQVERRMSTLFTVLQALSAVERDEPLLHRVDPIYGTLLMGTKLGTVPPWEMDVDLYLTLNEAPGDGKGPRRLSDRCVYVGQRVAAALEARGLRVGEWSKGEGFGRETAEWDDARGGFVPRAANATPGAAPLVETSGTTSLRMLAAPPDGQRSFVPHWAKSCDDLRERAGGYVLNGELWDICRERIFRWSREGIVKGYETGAGYAVELKCRRRGEERLPFYRVALAGPDSAVPAVVLPSGPQTPSEDSLQPVKENWSLSEYGHDVLGHPWGCYGSSL